MGIKENDFFIFTKEYDQETLFNLKIWLFELPEVEACQNTELKKLMRSSKDLVEIIGTLYLIRKEAS